MVNPFDSKANPDHLSIRSPQEPSHHGSIFNIGNTPAVKGSKKSYNQWPNEGEQTIQWAPIPPSITSAVSKSAATATSSNQQQASPAASSSESQPSAQPRPSSNAAVILDNQQQQQPSQAAFSFFPKTTAQQPRSIFSQAQQPQPASSIFAQAQQQQPASSIFSQAQQPQPASSIFAQAQQQQPASSIFAQAQQQQPASSIFSQSQQPQPASSIFAQAQQQQPASSIFTQGQEQAQLPQSQSSAESIFAQFGRNLPQPPTQSQQQDSGDFFARFSKDLNDKPLAQQSNMFTQGQQQPQAQQSQQPAGNPFAQNQQQHTQSQDEPPSQPNPIAQDNNPFAESIKSFLDSQPPPKPISEMFAHINQPKSLAPAQTQEHEASTSPNDYSMMSTSPDNASQSQPFAFMNQMQPSPTKGATAPGQGGSLFDRITLRDTQSTAQPASIFTQNNAIQASTSTSGGSGSFFDRISQANTESNTPAASIFMQANATQANTSASGQGGSLFDRITQRDTQSTAQPASVFAQNNATQASTTTSGGIGDAQSPTKNIIDNIKVPPTSQSSDPPSQSAFSPVKIPDFGNQFSSSPSTAQGSNSSNGEAPVGRREYGTPPAAPEDFADQEMRQLTTAWRLKALDKYVMHKTLRDIASANNATIADLYLVLGFFEKRKQAIIAANGGPVPSLAGSKRKAADEQPIDEVQEKKSRPEGSANFAPPAPTNSAAATSTYSAPPTLMNGTGPSQPSSTYQSPAQQFERINGKRKADKDLAREPDNGKKARSTNEVSYPSLSSISPGSETSSMFKNILDSKKQETKVNGLNGAKAPPNAPPQQTMWWSERQKLNASNQTSSEASTPVASNKAAAEALKAEALKAAASTQTFSETPKPPAFLMPATSSQTAAAAAKAPALEMPKFGAPGNFAEALRKKSAEDAKKKRKAEEFDSDEDDEEEWERMDAERERAKKQKLEGEQKGERSVLIDGKFVFTSNNKEAVAAATPTKPSDNAKADADATLTKANDNEEAAADAIIKKSTNSYDSVLNQPKSSLPNGTNIFGTNIFGHLSGSEFGAEGSMIGDADTDDEGEDEGHDEYDDEEGGDEEEHDQTEGPKSSTNPFDSRLLRSASPSKPSEKPNSGELFDRISRDDNGNVIREIPKSDGKPASQPSSVFSQAASTGPSTNPFIAVNASTASKDKPKAPFGTLHLPADFKVSLAAKDAENARGDHTWKADSPIKFGGSGSPPSVNVTSPSPTKPPFTGLFGAPKTNTATEMPTKPTSPLFSMTPTKTPSVGLGFGFTPSNPATKALAAPSNNASGASSRATSPGATTGESANESTADAEDDNAPRDEQIDLTAGGQGEEDEDLVFVVKGRAMVFNLSSKVWDTIGLGFLRVLKNRDTGKTRMVMRTDPSGKIILNASLSSHFKYTSSQKQQVRIPFANAEGKIEGWTLKVGKDGDAKALSKILEENKSN